MSQRFYERFVSVFFGFIILIALVVATAQLLFFYTLTQNVVFYCGYAVAAGLSLIYGTRYFVSLKNFKENLYLLIPLEAETSFEPLDVDADDKALKVCLYYRNGASYKNIAQDLGLKHPTQIKRQLVKGLDILLRFYDQNRKNVEKRT